MKRLLPLLLLGCAAPDPGLRIDVDRLEADSLRQTEKCPLLEGADLETAAGILESLSAEHAECAYRLLAETVRSRALRSKVDEDRESEILSEYLTAMSDAFPGSVFVFLAAVRQEEALTELGYVGPDACTYNLLELGPWRKHGILRTEWAAAGHAPSQTPTLRDAGEALADHPLGAAFRAFADAIDADDPAGAEAAARRIAKLAPDTPFPDAAWYVAVCMYADEDRLRDAERLWAERKSSRYSAAALYYLADSADEPRLARLQLEKHPHWEWDALSRVLLARLGPASEKLRHLQLVLDQPPGESIPLRAARSDAGEMLAEHWMAERRWDKAFDAWRDWPIWGGFCGNGWAEKGEKRNRRMIDCLFGMAAGRLPF